MDIAKIKEALIKAWSRETCYPSLQDKWTPENPSLGQCAVTALVIQDLFGGEIVYCKHLHHYWNKLPDGTELDLTREQFGEDANPCPDGIAQREYLLESERAKEAQTPQRYQLLKHKLNEIINEKNI